MESLVTQLQHSLEQKYEGLTLMLSFFPSSEEAPIVRINVIRFPKEKQKQGLGGQVMSELVTWADTHKTILTLSPTKDFGASSVSRLEKFYRRFGFKPNKGRSKDFRSRDTMIRYPAHTKVAHVVERFLERR